MHNLDAQFHMPLKKGGYRVKLLLIDHGIFINGMVVYPPSPKSEDWTVYTPATKSSYKEKPARIVEFDAKPTLWAEVQEACIDAVRLYLADNDIKDDLLELPKDDFDKEYSSELDKALKNFGLEP